MLAVLVAALVGSASPLPSVDDLIIRHHRALGRMTATTAHWTGTIAYGDKVQTFEVTADYTGRYRQSWTSPLGTILEGSDGKNDWTQDVNGDVSVQPAQHAFSFQYSLVRLNDFRLDSANKTEVSGPVKIDGRPAYALKVVDGDRSMTLYIDVDTALVDGADAGDHVIRYHEYRTFDGTPVPTVVQDTAEGSTVTRTVTDVKFGVSVTGAFDPPAPREPSFPSGITDVSTSFASPHGLIVLDAKINDKPIKLLLDSGSSSTVIDADVAKNLQLPTAGTAQVEGSGLLSGTYARSDKLDVAGITFAPFILEAVPLRLPAVIAHEGIQGVLGYDFLSHVVTRI